MLHGTEFLVAVAVFAVLAAVRSAGLPKAIAIAFAVGLIVSIVFGTNILNTAYRQLAIQFPPQADPGDIAFGIGAAIGAVVVGVIGLVLGARGGSLGNAFAGLFAGAVIGVFIGAFAGGLVRLALNPDSRPMIVGLLIWAVAAAVVGIIIGSRYGSRGALSGFGVGLIAGGAFGAFTAITFTWHVAIAIGIAVFFGLATALAGAFAANGGIDLEALKARYIPQATIDTTKETIEWAQARMPGGGRP